MSAQTPATLFLVSVLVNSIPSSAPSAEAAPPSKPAANTQIDGKDKPPLIIHNPDGTITAQREPASGKSGNAKLKGLVIPPQVIVPTARVPANDPPNQGR